MMPIVTVKEEKGTSDELVFCAFVFEALQAKCRPWSQTAHLRFEGKGVHSSITEPQSHQDITRNAKEAAH
eukprot:1161705-Pelagomonas_calceolata.AAC.2